MVSLLRRNYVHWIYSGLLEAGRTNVVQAAQTPWETFLQWWYTRGERVEYGTPHTTQIKLIQSKVIQGGFVSMAAGAPTVAASYLGLSTLLSFAQGVTTTAAIGGADMRECLEPLTLRL